MNKTSITTLALALLALPLTLQAEDIKDTFVCVTQDINVCKLHEGCRELHPVEMNSPDFWKIELKEKTITARRQDGSYGTVKIATQQMANDMIMMQGVLDTTENFEEGIGWTMAVHTGTGRMSIAVSAHEETISILGSCHAL